MFSWIWISNLKVKSWMESNTCINISMYLHIYRPRAIISRGLYIFYPIFKDHFFVFKEFFSEYSVLMYGLYSRAAYDGARTVMYLYLVWHFVVIASLKSEHLFYSMACTIVHRGAFCLFPFQWIYYYGIHRKGNWQNAPLCSALMSVELIKFGHV